MPRGASLSAAVATDLRTGRAACFRGGGGSAGSGLARSGAGGRVTSNQRRPGPSAKGSAIARAHALGGRSQRPEEALFRALRESPRDRSHRETRRGGGRVSRRRAARAAPPNISRRIAKSATRIARRRCVRGGNGAETHLGVRARAAGGAAGGRRGDRGGCGHGSRHRTRDSRVPEGSGARINDDALERRRYFTRVTGNEIALGRFWRRAESDASKAAFEVRRGFLRLFTSRDYQTIRPG